MRVVVAAALAMATVLLAGCNQAAKSANEPSQSPAAPVVAPVAISAPSAVVMSAVTVPRGKFDAISNTAMGVTGDLSAADGGFAFSQGQTYSLEGVGEAKGADPYASTKASLASLINIADTAALKVFRVTSEDRARARNGGFCGAEPTTFIVTHEGVDGGGSPALFLIAFQGLKPPSATSPEADLCGTFMYAPSAGPPATK